jgi:hypothetical protein
MLQQMQSSFVFVFECELQLVQQRWSVELKRRKKREPNNSAPQIEGWWFRS